MANNQVPDTRVYDELGNVISGTYGYTQYAGAGRGFINPSNAYVHQENNSLPADSENVRLEFQPNLLDNYDAVTYHWKLFMTSTADSGTGNVLKTSSQVVIAESGVSDLTIDKVELKGIAVPSVEAGTGTQTTVKFEIVEPAGAGLMDKMFYESISLGIGNWLVMPLYLQLEFRARDTETSNSDADGQPGALGNLRWLWALKISNVKANVTVGTRYEFDAIIYNELAQSNAYFSLQHNTVLQKIDTFENAMTELADKLNTDQFLKLVDNYSIPDVYKIVVDPKIAGYKITPSNSNINSARNNSYYSLHEKSANFNPGTSIDKIIDALLANTGEYQKAMLQAPTPGAEGVPIAAETNQMKKFWRVVTETRPIAFDKRRQDNAVEITIFIIDYDIGVLDANVFQSANDSKQTSIKRFMSYVNKGILKKKYNYIFTGLNDQIVAMDLNFNFAFASAVTRFGGIYLNSAMADKGAVNNDNSEIERQVTDKLRKVISLQNDATSANSAETKKAIEDYSAAIKTANLSSDITARYNTLLIQSRPENKLNFLNDAREYGGVNNDGTFSKNLSVAKSIAKPLGENIPAFVSDVNLTSDQSLSMYTDFVNSSRSKLRPVAHLEQNQDKSVGAGVLANSNTGVTKLASMFSVALHSGLDANLLSLKLTIKGDPFWLFPQPIKDNDSIIFNSLKPKQDAINFLKNGQITVPSSANVYGADNFIVVRFRTPRVFSTDSGSGQVETQAEVEIFSGVYRVTMITSRFEMGKFVQDMECILDPNINLSEITALIEFDAANQDVPTTVQTQRITNIPETSIKTKKILGANDIDGQSTRFAQGNPGGRENITQSNIPTAESNALPGLPNTFT